MWPDLNEADIGRDREFQKIYCCTAADQHIATRNGDSIIRRLVTGALLPPPTMKTRTAATAEDRKSATAVIESGADSGGNAAVSSRSVVDGVHSESPMHDTKTA